MSGFGPRIAARRNRLGMTLRDVEQVTGGAVSNAYLSQLENGKIKNPSAKMVLALSAAYHVAPSDMLDWLGEKTDIKPPSICPTCGRARIGETWIERLGVVIDTAATPTPQVGEDVREKIARALFEQANNGRLAAWSDVTRAFWFDRANAILASAPEAFVGGTLAEAKELLRDAQYHLRVDDGARQFHDRIEAFFAQPSTAQPSEDDAALVRRLRSTTCVQIDPERQAIRNVNPDGPEAADRIEALSNLKSSPAKDPGNG